MTLPAYSALLAASGLSQREAAALHGVRLDTVKSWSSGRRSAPEGALRELAALVVRQSEAVEATLEEIERHVERRGEPETIELGLAADDAEAQALGWPSVSAHRVVIGRVVAAAILDGHRIAVVPRGATAATAAAADALDRARRRRR